MPVSISSSTEQTPKSPQKCPHKINPRTINLTYSPPTNQCIRLQISKLIRKTPQNQSLHNKLKRMDLNTRPIFPFLNLTFIRNDQWYTSLGEISLCVCKYRAAENLFRTQCRKKEMEVFLSLTFKVLVRVKVPSFLRWLFRGLERRRRFGPWGAGIDSLDDVKVILRE